MIHQSISDIKYLARERPLITNEILRLNDAYGHAYTLKKYAKLKETYQIKGVIEHPAMLFDQVFIGEVNFALPAHFTLSKYRFPYLRQLTNKALFAIGPSIHYAKPLFSEQEIENIKKALGKTLLVFPPHSAISVIVNTDQEKIISHIKAIEKEYDNIIICLGWKEVLLNVDKIYKSQGYTCVTAGHAFDMNFLSRLKSIILIATHTMSFNFGTHIGFCVYLNKPHWIIPMQLSITGPKEITKKIYYKRTPVSAFQENYLFKKFKEPTDFITEDQKEVIDLIWGISEVKSSEELREILNIAEDMFRSKYYPTNKRDPLILCQIIDYIEQKDIEKAKFLLKYAKKINYHPGWILYLNGLIAIEEKRLADVEKIIVSLKRYGEYFKQRALVLENLKNEDQKNKNSLNDFLKFFPRPPYYRHVKFDLPWKREGI